MDKRIVNLIAKEHELGHIQPGNRVHIYCDAATGQIALRVTASRTGPPM